MTNETVLLQLAINLISTAFFTYQLVIRYQESANLKWNIKEQRDIINHQQEQIEALRNNRPEPFPRGRIIKEGFKPYEHITNEQWIKLQKSASRRF